MTMSDQSAPDEDLSVAHLDLHMPSAFRSADAASMSAQRSHVWLRASHLSLLVFGSMVFILANLPSLSTWANQLHVIWTLALVFVLFLPIVSMARKDDKRWFSCRAAAESIKSITWRYIMKVEPFGGDDDTARNQFTSSLRDIMQEASTAGLVAEHVDPEGQAITASMTIVRSMDFEHRRDLYRQCRVADQKSWYSNKARACSKNERLFQRFLILVPFIATISLLLYFYLDYRPLAATVPFLMTVTAAATAWAQTKRYAELAISYSHVAVELTNQEVQVASCQESEFNSTVDQVETAISKEHNIWRVRRDMNQLQ